MKVAAAPQSVFVNDSAQTDKQITDKQIAGHKEDATLGKKILYHSSLAYTMANQLYRKGLTWWNPIKGERIILGGIPLKNKEHHTQILKFVSALYKTEKLAVLTLLELFEIHSNSPIATPVKPEDWKKLNVEQKIIIARDFKPLSKKEIDEAVAFLEALDKQGIPIYVHCKAGRGRSATAVVCFLMKKYGYTAEKAKEVVKESRSQINLNKHQWQAIKDYEARLNSISL